MIDSNAVKGSEEVSVVMMLLMRQVLVMVVLMMVVRAAPQDAQAWFRPRPADRGWYHGDQ